VYEKAAKEVALSVVGGINCEFLPFVCFSSFTSIIRIHGISVLISSFDLSPWCLIDQQAFLRMDKQAAGRHTP